jgi:two-component system, response regulator RegA
MVRTILFVDDSALARAAAVRGIGELGLPVTALGSWREAEGVDPTRFAAALLDIELGDGSGPDLAALFRRASPALPIAFLTGGGAASVLDAARAIGPVFEKSAGVDAAIVWVVEAARAA